MLPNYNNRESSSAKYTQNSEQLYTICNKYSIFKVILSPKVKQFRAISQR